MRPNRIALLGLLCLLTTPTFAATRYDVDLVVFEHTGATGERWRPMIALPDFKRARAFDPESAGIGRLPSGFQRLSASAGALQTAKKRLQRSSSFHVLRHLRWRQPALGPNESVPIRIHAGQPMSLEAPAAMIARPVPAAGNPGQTRDAEKAARDSAADTSSNTPQAAGDSNTTASSTEAGTRNISVYPLDGTVELVVSRYLHIQADLYYTAPVDWQRTTLAPRTPSVENTPEGRALTPTTTDGPDTLRIPRDPQGRAMLTFPMKQSRRMRSGNLHYIDHPRVGLLVLVTPVE